MTISIEKTARCHFKGLRHVFETVAQEKRYLAYLKAPPIEENYLFYQNIVDNDLCHVVAINNDVVVGWCDVLPTRGEARSHVGILGIGLLPYARRRGIGAQFMASAIASAWEKGFSRIELTVRTDNANAKALYERFGFVVEGINRRAFCVDGGFFDTYSMALLR